MLCRPKHLANSWRLEQSKVQELLGWRQAAGCVWLGGQVYRLPAGFLLPAQLPEAAQGCAHASVQGCEGSKDSISTACSIRKQCVTPFVMLSDAPGAPPAVLAALCMIVQLRHAWQIWPSQSTSELCGCTPPLCWGLCARMSSSTHILKDHDSSVDVVHIIAAMWS